VAAVDTSVTEQILATCSDEDIEKHTRELAARVDELEKDNSALLDARHNASEEFVGLLNKVESLEAEIVRLKMYSYFDDTKDGGIR